MQTAAAADGECKPPPRQKVKKPPRLTEYVSRRRGRAKTPRARIRKDARPRRVYQTLQGDELGGALAGEAAAGAFCAAGVFCAAGAGHFQNQKSNGALWRSPALRGYGGKNKRRKRFRVRGAAPSRPKISPFCGGGRRWRDTAPRTAPCSPPESPPSSAAR